MTMTQTMPKARKALPYWPTKITAEQKIHGGKHYLCRRIFKIAPKGYTKFADLYGGAGSMTYNAPQGLAQQIFCEKNWFRYITKCVIRDDLKGLQRELHGVTYSQEWFDRARTFIEVWKNRKTIQTTKPKEQAEVAAMWIIKNRMSRGGLGESFAWSDRLRGGQPGDLNAWCTMLERLPELSTRLSPIVLQNGLAMDTFDELTDAPDVREWFVYLDPPYPKEVRTADEAYGEDEMTIEQHEEMLRKANDADCKVAISSYSNPLYNKMLSGWRREEFNLPNHSGQGKEKQRRIEVLYMNY